MTCPICARDTHDKYRPFCSRRCADVDLGRWLTGGYAVPASGAEEDQTAADGPDPQADGLRDEKLRH